MTLALLKMNKKHLKTREKEKQMWPSFCSCCARTQSTAQMVPTESGPIGASSEVSATTGPAHRDTKASDALYVDGLLNAAYRAGATVDSLLTD